MTNETNKQTVSTMTSTMTSTTPSPAQSQPAPNTTTPSDAKTSTPTQTADKTATAGTLPAGYLASGSMLDADGVMLPEYLEKYPQALAEALKPLSAASFERAFLSKARAASKKKTPYSDKKNTAQGMVITALKLVNRTKDPAPAVLLDMVKLATATVADEATFAALCLHFEAVSTYLLMN